jgi:hypothetical protein
MQETGWKCLHLVRLDPKLAGILLVLSTAVRTVNDPELAEQLDGHGIRVVLKPFRRLADHAGRGPHRAGAD